MQRAGDVRRPLGFERVEISVGGARVRMPAELTSYCDWETVERESFQHFLHFIKSLSQRFDDMIDLFDCFLNRAETLWRAAGNRRRRFIFRRRRSF